ncbi:MAG: hemerythrin domain-containing protein [Gemmatimonadota bacterium]|nr:hemerythrin domain-containing protein [Gemmatimonadota bacterium]
MKAIDVLMDEHRVIERVLDALETAAGRLDRGEPVPAQFFLDAAEFASGFADRCHHGKEEGVLFQAMERHGEPADGGLVGMLKDEHVEGRRYVQAIREAAAALGRGDASAARRVASTSYAYSGLLREHIEKEDEGVFPMAADLIPAAEHAGVLARFADGSEADPASAEYARYLALAARLEREAGAPGGARRPGTPTSRSARAPP